MKLYYSIYYWASLYDLCIVYHAENKFKFVNNNYREINNIVNIEEQRNEHRLYVRCTINYSLRSRL